MIIPGKRMQARDSAAIAAPAQERGLDGKGRARSGFLGRPPWVWALLAMLLGIALAAAAAALHARAHDRQEAARQSRIVERAFDAVERQLQTCGLLARAV